MVTPAKVSKLLIAMEKGKLSDLQEGCMTLRSILTVKFNFNLYCSCLFIVYKASSITFMHAQPII